MLHTLFFQQIGHYEVEEEKRIIAAPVAPGVLLTQRPYLDNFASKKENDASLSSGGCVSVSLLSLSLVFGTRYAP